MYVQAFVYSPVARPKCWSGASLSSFGRMWVNGELKGEGTKHIPFRPSQAYGNTPDMTYGDVALRQGWNEVLF